MDIREAYERANTLEGRVKGKVRRASVRPNWIDGGPRFWYRNDLPGDRREFVLVDPEKPEKRPAFDHARLARSLSKAMGQPVDGDRLPVDRIAFAPGGKRLSLQAGEATYTLDLKTYELEPGGESLGRAEPLSPESSLVSRNGGGEVVLTFINHTGEEVSLLWVDTGGNRHDYGTIKAGDSRPLHTYAGHAWLVMRPDGRALVGFAATDFPALAVIEERYAFPAPPPPDEPERSPDGKWKAIVRDHNVFLLDVKSGRETPLTADGSAEDRYEGRPYWSPNSRKFVLSKTIPAQEHTVYTVESSPKDQVQPRLKSYDYLKPGDRIAHYRLHLFDVESRRNRAVKDDLVPIPWDLDRVEWEPDSRRFTFLYNRRGHQVMRLLSVDADTGDTKVVIDEESKTFIDYSGKTFLHLLHGAREAVWMSERSGWNHLYLYDLDTGKVKNPVTQGEWVVREVDLVDEKARQIRFRAGGVVPGQDPYYVHLCRVNLDGNGLTVLTEGDGAHETEFSPDGTVFVDRCSRVDLPPVTTLRRTIDGKKLLDLERADPAELLETGWQYPERFVAKGRDGRTDIYGVIVRPARYDPTRKYPVIENIYAGPQSAYVPKAFSEFNGMMRLAELGFVVVQIDGMGTSGRSKAFHDVCWKNLADAGFPDRIPWMKAAAERYPYMDLERVGLYGVSAGGQNALGGLLLHGDFYKAAVADCGCHDNRMDKIWWNEQWMGWPVGPHYAEQSNVTLAPKLRGNLLLMVGELDDNVDPASTMQVVNALIEADKDFELLVVPGAGHGTSGSPYGQRRLMDFFVRHLRGETPPHRNAVPSKKPGGG